MFLARKRVLCVVILVGLLLPGLAANATVEVTTGFVSERRTTFISLHHEDASPFPLLVAELAQSVNALDNAFRGLQTAGQLLPAYPALAISVSDDVHQRLLPAGPMAEGYAVLSLVNDYRLDLDPQDVFSADAIALGPVYSIELALWPVSFNELLTLVLLLPRLSADNPRIELLAADIRGYRDEFDAKIARSAGEWSYSDLLWSSDGNLLLTAIWHNRRLSYQVFDFAAREVMNLESLHHYILPPTFSPDSRFIVYASQTELKIVDLKTHRTSSFSLQTMAPDKYQFISWVRFASNKVGDTLFFSLYGWAMPAPLTFLWRSAEPEQTEVISGVEFFAKPNLPGETWSDFLHRRHPSVGKMPDEFVALKAEMAGTANIDLPPLYEQLQAKYGAVYAVRVNYPHNNRLAVLIEGADRLEARVLDLPSLREIDVHRFNHMPRLRTIIPGQIAGISLFNGAVVAIILLLAAGMTWLVILMQQKFARQATASISRKKKFIFFAGALLLTLLLHFAVSIFTLLLVGDDMGDWATDTARQAVTARYAERGHTVEFGGGLMAAMMGSSPLAHIDSPYQVLYWRLSGFTQFAAPVDIGFAYTVYDQQGHFVARRAVRYYVLGVDRIIESHLPW